MPKNTAPSAGLIFSDAFTGKFLHRVRESHVQTYTRLLADRLPGAVKLDLLLRAVAFYPQHLNGRQDDPGITRPGFSYDDIYDLIGPTDGTLPLSAADMKRRRKWVARQLTALEELTLVRRVTRRGDTPRLWVLRDDRTGEPFDDPGEGAKEDGTRFVTMVMAPFASGHARSWGVPELTVYLAAMAAEVYERQTTRSAADIGERQWARTPAWFAGPGNLKGGTISFGESSFYDGLQALEQQGLLRIDYVRSNPWTSRPWKGGPRNVYTNRFVSGTLEVLEARSQLREAVTPDDLTVDTPQAQRL